MQESRDHEGRGGLEERHCLSNGDVVMAATLSLWPLIGMCNSLFVVLERLLHLFWDLE